MVGVMSKLCFDGGELVIHSNEREAQGFGPARRPHFKATARFNRAKTSAALCRISAYGSPYSCAVRWCSR